MANSVSMSDQDIKNLSSSMTALTKQIEKNNAAMLVGSDTAKDIRKETIRIEESEKKQNGFLKEMGSNLKDALNSTLKVSSTMASIGTMAFGANILKDMVDLDNSMTSLSVRMGKGKEGIKELKGSVTSLQKEFGTSYENAKNLVEELAKDKYVGNIKEAAAGIDLFSRASGVSNGEVLELTNTLSKMGGISDKTINSMYASMVKVQQKVGISEKGMQALTSTISDMTMNMVAFGKSSEEIRQMTVQTTALVGAMEKVGISAERSTKLVEQLTDPDRIEDNILLYSQLGISMEDALSGDIDMSTLDSQFKDMADRIVSMGPIAGSAFAREMGLSYKEMTKMANMEAGSAEQLEEEAATSEEAALGTLKELEAATEGIGTKMETGINKLEGAIKGLPPLLLAALTGAIPLLLKAGKSLIHKIFDKDEIQASIEDGTTNGMDEAEGKAKDSIARVAAGIPGAFGNTLKKTGDTFVGGVKKLGNNITGWIGQWFEASSVGGFFDGIDAQMDAAYAKATKKKFTDAFFDTSSINLKDTIKAQIEESENYAEGLKSKIGDLGVDLPVDQLEQLDLSSWDELSAKLEEQGGLTKAELKSVKLMAEQYNKTKQHQENLNNLKKRSLGYRDEDLKALKESQKEVEKIKKDKDDQLNKENKVNDLFNKRLQMQKQIKDMQDQAGTLEEGSAAAEEMQARIDQLQDDIKNNEDALVEAKDALQKTSDSNNKKYGKKGFDKAIEQQEKQQSNIDKKVSDRNAQKTRPQKFFGGIKNKIDNKMLNSKLGGQIMDNIAERDRQSVGGISAGRKVGIAAKTTLKAGAKGAAKGLGKGALSAVKGIGKGMGKLLKFVGPMAIVSKVIGKLMEKIQDPLEKMLDGIINMFMPIIDALMPAIMVLVDSVVNVICTKLLPPALKVLASILKVLHIILKPLVWILKALEHIPIIGGALAGIGEALDAATGPEVSDAMMDAADSLKTSSFHMSDYVDKEEEKEEKDSEGPEKIQAEGGKLVSDGTTSTEREESTNQQAASSFSNTPNNNGSEAALKDEQKAKATKKANSDLDGIRENTDSIGILVKLCKEIVEAIKQKPVDLNSVEAPGISFSES